jgi:hypothetical protein
VHNATRTPHPVAQTINLFYSEHKPVETNMTDTVLEKTIALRAEVLREVINSSAFQSFKALDAAVSSMGGKSMLSGNLALFDDSPRSAASSATPVHRRRLSQGDVAEQTLKAFGQPMHIRALLDAVLTQDVEIRGENPLANFRSTLSRDPRFKSVMRNGGYFWWLNGVALPDKWGEAEADDLVARLASAPVSSSQEGGDGHVADNTILAS